MGLEKQIDPNAQPGLRIKLVKMHDDPRPIDGDLEGMISHIDSLGTIHVNWDDGRFLGVIPNVDEYVLYPPSDQVIDDLDSVFTENDTSVINRSMPKPTLRGSKSTPAGKAVNKTWKSDLGKTNPKVRDIKVEDEVKGGEADKLSVEDLAKKHDVSVEDIKKELKVGRKVEMEHTDDENLAKEIAMDHIAEYPDFYTNPKHGSIASEKGLEKVHEAFFGFGKKKNKDDQFDNMKMAREIKTIAKSIETMKPGQDDTIKKMIENFRNKYSEHSLVGDIIKSLYAELDSKFDDIDETTMAGGGASTGAFVGPLDGPVKRKSVYEPKNENIIKVKDLMNEIADTKITKVRNAGAGYDGNAWVGDKKDDGWNFNDEPAWDGGEIVDILAKLDINWVDGNLTVDTIKEAVKKHVDSIEEEEELDETTTFGSVWGGDGPPITPTFAAKKGQHIPSKKSIYKGGKIVQKIKNSGVMTEENTIKYVKGGKFVKIKDKCAKYRNNEHCSDGAIDDPLELSDTTFKNVQEVAKKLGITEEEVLNKLKSKLLKK